MLLDSWKTSDDEVSFQAKDVVAALNGTYYWGVYGNANLYDLAIDVLTDAGLEERDYNIDSYLKNVHVVNPLPVATHAECLQIIANAGESSHYSGPKRSDPFKSRVYDRSISGKDGGYWKQCGQMV